MGSSPAVEADRLVERAAVATGGSPNEANLRHELENALPAFLDDLVACKAAEVSSIQPMAMTPFAPKALANHAP